MRPGLDALRRCASTGLDPDLQGKLAEGVRAGESKKVTERKERNNREHRTEQGRGRRNPKKRETKPKGNAGGQST